MRFVEAGELASLKAVSEVFRRDALEVEQESLEAALPVADGLDVAWTPNSRFCGLVQSDVGQSERPRSGRVATRCVGDHHDLRRRRRVQRRPEGRARPVRSEQDRHEILGKPARLRFSAAPPSSTEL